ncbi:MAG: SPFH domain-containing protein, partial [Erythrobacter sp.]|nr:SPFH domain-containing protein [Erythrobacter sp.]
MAIADTPALNRSREIPAATQSGYMMLLVSLVLVVAAVWLFISAMTPDDPDGLRLVGAIITGVIGVLVLTGFYMINPNEA